MKIHTQLLLALLLGFKRNWHIFLGLVLGVLAGAFLPKEQFPIAYKIFNAIGQTFINTIQMVVIPLVVSAIIIGISSIGDNKQLARFGKKMIFYYAIITVCAVTIGALLGVFMHPGTGAREFINPDIAQELQGVVASMMDGQNAHFLQIFLNLIKFFLYFLLILISIFIMQFIINYRIYFYN